MKKKALFFIALAALSALFAGTNVAAQAKTYKVGEKGPAGGIIFYDKGYVIDGWRYLEAAPSDLEKKGEWQSTGLIATYVSGTTMGFGYGKQNTRKIIDTLKDKNSAAQWCANLNTGGYNDWYLPNLTELKMMYENLKKKNLGGLKDDWYWSSMAHVVSGDFVGWAWTFNFKTGATDSSLKGGNYWVRAVRQFQ